MLLLLALLACDNEKYTADAAPDTADTAATVDETGDGGGTSDADGDGYAVSDGDCDDGNGAINPEATDIVGDGVDQNCDGVDGFDGDGDGVAADWSGGTDCDDEDPAVSEGQTFYPDDDGDGFGNDVRAYTDCSADDGWITRGGDCDDGNSAVNPDAEEVGCDGIDNDCDPATDDFIPGSVAPTIDAMTVSNGGLYDFGGETYPSVELGFALSDGDGDLGEVTRYTWIDDSADGGVDTSASPTYTSDLSVGSGDLCGYAAISATLTLAVGTTLAYDTLYEFAVIAEDASGNQSSPYTLSGYTPKSDGTDGG